MVTNFNSCGTHQIQMSNAVHKQISIQAMSVGMARVKEKLDGQGENICLPFIINPL